MLRILGLFVLLMLSSGACAQVLTDRNEFVAAFGSGDYAPLWHVANKQGLNSEKTGSLYTRLGVSGEHPFSSHRLELDWGFDFVVGHNLVSRIFIQQAFLDVRWKRLNVSLGQKERWCDMKNPRLSTGALLESGNARPVPQVRVGLPEYWDIPGLGGWFAMRAHIAYGWFTDGRWQGKHFADSSVHTTGVCYHSKSGHVRFGNEKRFPLTVEMGLRMATQFGGTCYNSMNRPGNDHTNPTRLKDYFYAFIPLKGDDSYDGSDQANVAGNVLGSWVGAINWKGKDWRLRLYYDHVFEDHSQMFWEYGLWTEQLVGVELNLGRFKWLRSVVFEYFNLKDQSGPVYHDSTPLIPDQISCQDNNYNHGRYAGWFNYGRMIGTPLCTSPLYNKDRLQVCYNNRVEAFHFGAEGELLTWLDYRVLLTASNNWGTYKYPYKDIKRDVSGLVELTFVPSRSRRWSLSASFAFDAGELYGNNYGGMITLRRGNVFDLKKIFGW